jgi:hypothetical protein
VGDASALRFGHSTRLVELTSRQQGVWFQCRSFLEATAKKGHALPLATSNLLPHGHPQVGIVITSVLPAMSCCPGSVPVRHIDWESPCRPGACSARSPSRRCSDTRAPGYRDDVVSFCHHHRGHPEQDQPAHGLTAMGCSSRSLILGVAGGRPRPRWNGLGGLPASPAPAAADHHQLTWSAPGALLCKWGRQRPLFTPRSHVPLDFYHGQAELALGLSSNSPTRVVS